MKKIGFILLAATLAFGMTQCKKDNITPASEDKTVFMTLDAGYGGGRTVFDPSAPGFNWSNGTEYISVGSSVSGYLGELSGTGTGTSAAASRIIFSGNITAPAGTEGEKIYFFYLGNGSHSGATSLDFSNQSAAGTTATVTNYIVAIGEGRVTNSGATYTATADLEVKTAIAYFNDSDMGTGNVYLHGNDVYSTATINYTSGTITGNTKGWINMGTASVGKYIALIPSVSTETTLVFDSDTKAGGMTFLRGIQANRYYSNDSQALEITGNEAVFTVNDSGKQVRFSSGNLQAVFAEANNTSCTWQFAPTQYSFIGNATANTAVGDNCVTTAGTVDLFGWVGASGTLAAYGINSSTSSDAYGGNNTEALKGDWCIVANAANLGGHNNWRTLSSTEMGYLFERRTDASQKYGHGKVNGVNGMIILPDVWVLPVGLSFTAGNSEWANSYDIDKWAQMEANGAVFLPAAGRRDGVTVSVDGSIGYYWTTDYMMINFVLASYIASNTTPAMMYTAKRYGCSVRLARYIN